MARYAKAITAALTVLVGALVQALGPDSPWVAVITAVAALITTYVVPNKTSVQTYS